MRVMLVSPFTDVPAECKHAPRPEIGDIDEVTGEFLHDGKRYYYLARFGTEYAYQVDLFSPLDDTPAEVIEETELVTA